MAVLISGGRMLGRFGVIAALFATGTSAKGCDATEAFERFLNDQGLMLLRPARDYIKVGGIFVQRSNGVPGYNDPIDSQAQLEAPSDFRSILYRETQNKSATFDSAWTLLGRLLPVPGDAKYSKTQDITLSQITTGGTRLTTNQVDRLIDSRDLRGALVKFLGTKGTRVFIVQEVYTATDIEVKAVRQQNLELTIDGTSPAVCGEQQPQTKAGSAKTQTTEPATTPDAPSKRPAPPGGGLRVCRSSDTSLALKTPTAIPFAVRLVELELKRGSIRGFPPGESMPGHGKTQGPGDMRTLVPKAKAGSARIGPSPSIGEVDYKGKLDLMKVLMDGR